MPGARHATLSRRAKFVVAVIGPGSPARVSEHPPVLSDAAVIYSWVHKGGSMKLLGLPAALLAATCASLVSMGAIAKVEAQTAAGQPGAPLGRGGGGRGGVAGPLFTALDANKDGSLTRDEMKSSFDKWFTDG